MRYLYIEYQEEDLKEKDIYYTASSIMYVTHVSGKTYIQLQGGERHSYKPENLIVVRTNLAEYASHFKKHGSKTVALYNIKGEGVDF